MLELLDFFHFFNRITGMSFGFIYSSIILKTGTFCLHLGDALNRIGSNKDEFFYKD